MHTDVKTLTLLLAILLTGLSAGLFFAWQVSVIPGTRKVTDMVYTQVMQSINRAILNPSFFSVFFGSLLILTISTIQHYRHGSVFWLLLAATLAYLIGTVAVTGMGNVPLNNQLDVLKLDELNPTRLEEFRTLYEGRWNRLHLIRTLFAVISFLLSIIALNFKG